MTNDSGQLASSERFRFAPWTNYLVPGFVIVAIAVLTYIPLLVSLLLSPTTTDIGYRPEQPVAFSHATHAGQLKMDCRYCHSTVESTAFAAVPATKVCMNCHASIGAELPTLKAVRDSYSSGDPISWKKIHDQPDFVFFNHSAHINHGVGCVTCHGRIDQMETVHQDKSLSMAWCLECHRNPATYLRPRSEITNMEWDAAQLGKTQSELGSQLAKEYEVHNSKILTNCTTCHR
jgi:menaquinone reductase, multiheme cytochrome c subunit